MNKACFAMEESLRGGEEMKMQVCVGDDLTEIG